MLRRPHPSQPARMRCGKDALCRNVFVRPWSQPARMRCGKAQCLPPSADCRTSQPARMRCGKEVWRLEYAVKIIVATRTNALRQSQYRHGSLTASPSRNPRECAEAKCSMPASALMPCCRNPRECAEAKSACGACGDPRRRRNPRECAVAKINQPALG